MHYLKTTSIACISYLLILVLLKLLTAPLYYYKPVPDTSTSIPAIVSQIAYCESRNNPSAYVADDGGSPSAGLLQFKLTTFHYHWNRLVNPDFSLVDARNLWTDATSQRYLAQRMLEDNPNLIRSWYNCGKKIGLI